MFQSEHAAIANAGVYFESRAGDYPREPYTKMNRGGRWTKLSGLADFTDASVALDGSVVVTVADSTAFSWIAGGAMKPYLLLEGTGNVPPVAGNKYFAAAHDNAVWDAERPRNRWDHVDGVCSADSRVTALAMTHDESRVIAGCAEGGLRVVSIETAEIARPASRPSAEGCDRVVAVGRSDRDAQRRRDPDLAERHGKRGVRQGRRPGGVVAIAGGARRGVLEARTGRRASGARWCAAHARDPRRARGPDHRRRDARRRRADDRFRAVPYGEGSLPAARRHARQDRDPAAGT